MRSLSLLSLLLLAACVGADKDGVDTADVHADVDADGDGYLVAEDCDDSDAATHPGATEICDGIDNNCDDLVDEGVLDTWYADADGDGYGDAGVATTACDAPEGFVPTATDCDDTDADVYPSAPEVCDGLDNDCDGEVDDGVLGTWYADGDGDGFGDAETATTACEAPAGFVADATDCDDSSPLALPGGIEVCDGLDNDCDGFVDEDDATDAHEWYADVDGDGFGDPDSTTHACAVPSGYVDGARDCDDTDPDVRPTAPEVCDGIDNDCDGFPDDADPDVDLSTGGTWYADTDGDGYGDAAAPTSACDQPASTVGDATDCDDTDAAVSPAGTEVCNGIDDDCDALVDDEDSDVDLSTGSTWYADTDGDGYGDSAVSTTACAAPSGTVSADGDCDDADSDVSPGEAPWCDGEDHDCDGYVDSDDDLDGYADEACGGDDCDDTDAAIRPDSTGDCALGLTCDDILDNGRSTGDGDYVIDPDGYGTGLDPFTVTCDMTTDGGGWTEIAYTDDLAFQQWFTTGDTWRYQASDFSLELGDAQIAAIQALSVEGTQTYVGRCEHVIHHYYNDGGTYGYAFGFMFLDGTETPRGSSSYAPHDITVTADGCATNGGEGGSLSSTTDFVIDSVLVPVVNVQCRDCGDAFPEEFGSDLTDNPAWLR